MSGQIRNLDIQKLDLNYEKLSVNFNPLDTPPSPGPLNKCDVVNTVVARPKVKGIVVIEADPRKRKTRKRDNDFSKSQPSTVKGGYPLRLLLPEHAAEVTGCPWIYPMTFGGGIVAGDSIELQIIVQSNCCALLTSQESLKVYHCPDDQISEQVLLCTVNKGALLCVLPDPVVCFKEANYKQTQRIQLSCHGNIALLDWFLAGRVARGELWEFTRFVNNLEVYVDDKLVLRDRIDLADTVNEKLYTAMNKYAVMGTFLVLGEKLQNLSNDLFNKFGLSKEFGTKYDSSCMVSATKLKYIVNHSEITGVYIKVMADTTTKAFEQILEMVTPLFPIIGGDPFDSKY